MSKAEINENKAIAQLMKQRCSSGYRRAVDKKLPVTYVSGKRVICEHNGERTVVARVEVSTRLRTPKTYILK